MMNITAFANSTNDNRRTMEDKYTMNILDLDKSGKAYYYAVYDGHGGILVVSIVNAFLHLYIEKQLRNIDLNNENLVKNVITNCFEKLNECMYENINKTDISGCTANLVIYFELVNKLYLINLGDSRSVVWDREKIIYTIDHKPNNPIERQRIQEKGGFVIMDRVNGLLNISRAFGDFNITGLSVIPDITVINLEKNWYRFILATDGLWDVFPNQIITSSINEDVNLAEKAINSGSNDNITLIIGELYRLNNLISFQAIKTMDDIGETLKGIILNNTDYQKYLNNQKGDEIKVKLITNSKIFKLKKDDIVTIVLQGKFRRPIKII
jgi:protein phosphatase 1L